VLAADAQMQIRTGLRPSLTAYSMADGRCPRRLIHFCEGVGSQRSSCRSKRQELAGVVAGEAEGHLGQVVGAEGEELGLGGDRSAVTAARGSSIMVPTLYFMLAARSWR
jgi:hypothetical protein